VSVDLGTRIAELAKREYAGRNPGMLLVEARSMAARNLRKMVVGGTERRWAASGALARWVCIGAHADRPAATESADRRPEQM
jgi:hypothetical protein